MNVEELWNQRSKKYKTNPKGVLPKSFPGWLNRTLHNWMYSQIRPYIKNEDKVLDLGCGYGRLAVEVASDFRQSKIYGVDLSENYVDLFNKKLKNHGRAYKADIRKLPFKSKTFDVVYMVTTLMYLVEKKDQITALKEIYRVLKPKGKFIFIERNPTGFSILTLGGLVTKLRGSKNKEIESVSFTPAELTTLIKQTEGKLKAKSSFPFGDLLTASLYIAYIGNKK